ncbi:MAG: peptidylprolyl isomerase [Bacteroidota bacterium]|nr:peptidylprolyl isomerase [Bacteroidota bacterium]
MKYQKTIIFLCLSFIGFSCTPTEKDSLVTISTQFGDMNLILYDETPQHKENFLKLARENRYDSTIFHRVIPNFMVQGGDVNAKTGTPNAVSHTIPAEINNHLIHEKGAIAAARQGDQINPKKESSGDQFYFVHGKVFTNEELDELEENQNAYSLQVKIAELLKKPEYAELRNEFIQLQRDGNVEGMKKKFQDSRAMVEKEYGPQPDHTLTDAQRQAYTSVGGSPHLDREYTVFGKVIGGLAVIDSIASQSTGPGDKPHQNIYMKVKVEEVSKEEITKRYGYQYPEKKENAVSN